MVQFSTTFCCTPLYSLLSKFPILLCFRNFFFFFILHPHSSRTSPLLFRPTNSMTMLAPDNSETEDVVTVAANLSKVHSLKAAILHTMAFKLSLEINTNKITQKSLIAFLKVLYNISKIKKKKITFEQYSRGHLDGPKIAICETASNVVFVLNSSFTSKDQYFEATIQEATTAFNNTLPDFGYTQTLEPYISYTHQTHPPPQNPLFQ